MNEFSRFFLEGICSTTIVFFWMKSQMKWYFLSMCLLFLCLIIGLSMLGITSSSIRNSWSHAAPLKTYYILYFHISACNARLLNTPQISLCSEGNELVPQQHNEREKHRNKMARSIRVRLKIIFLIIYSSVLVQERLLELVRRNLSVRILVQFLDPSSPSHEQSNSQLLAFLNIFKPHKNV